MEPPPSPPEEPRDLGFGAVVARESRTRLLNRDGSFNVRRVGLGLRARLSPYQDLLAISWGRFLALAVVAYLLVNAAFAGGYLLCGPDALHGEGGLPPEAHFARAFFFSVHTLATIGYGTLSPNGLAANLLVTVESLVGLLGFAVVTGLVFARFARPSARIAFSEHALIAPFRDGTAFMFRIANRRRNELVDVHATVTFSRLRRTGEQLERTFHTLALERTSVAFFPLSWTVVHPIDADSPLWGLTEADLREGQAEFLILLSAVDDTLAQTVHVRSSYRGDEVLFGAKFKSIFNRDERDGSLSVDIRGLHEIEPAALPVGSPPGPN